MEIEKWLLPILLSKLLEFPCKQNKPVFATFCSFTFDNKAVSYVRPWQSLWCVNIPFSVPVVCACVHISHAYTVHVLASQRSVSLLFYCELFLTINLLVRSYWMLLIWSCCFVFCVENRKALPLKRRWMNWLKKWKLLEKRTKVFQITTTVKE